MLQRESLEDQELDRHYTTRFEDLDVDHSDRKSIGMTWKVAQQLAVNREGWRRRVAQSVFDTA